MRMKIWVKKGNKLEFDDFFSFSMPICYMLYVCMPNTSNIFCSTYNGRW